MSLVCRLPDLTCLYKTILSYQPNEETQCYLIQEAFWIVALMALFCGNASAQYPAHVKFLSYNLWGYKNAETPGGYDQLATVINELNPDISGHQEVDFKNDRSKGVNVIGHLAKRTKMHPIFAPGLKNYQNGQYGEGLLSDFPPVSKKLFWIEQPGGEDRSAIEIEITMAGEKSAIPNHTLGA